MTKTSTRFIAAGLLLMAAACFLGLTAPDACKAEETSPVKITFFDPRNKNKVFLEVEKQWCLKRDGEDKYSWHGPGSADMMCLHSLKILKDANANIHKNQLFGYIIKCTENISCCSKAPENYVCFY